MKTEWPLAGLCAALLVALPGIALARADNVQAERIAPDRILVTWSDEAPVDLYQSDKPDADPAKARAISLKDRDGREEIAVEGTDRPYFLVRDEADGSIVTTAERLLPLAQGSNFRDIGGYETVDGKHVRWGLIYRSGATPLLSDSDLAQIGALGLHNMVDLRSDEERVLAPTKIDGVPYTAVGYSMREIFKGMGSAPAGNGGQLYRNFPTMLAPQMKILFAMLERGEGPVVYNCSAGQDRTGFATAMILSALGVPRETIFKDYHLSTQYRHPEFEMPKINAEAFPDNAMAQFMARGHGAAAMRKPQPLYDPDGTSLLSSAFDEIDRKWGSVEAYLDQVVGVSAEDIASLRAQYLD